MILLRLLTILFCTVLPGCVHPPQQAGEGDGAAAISFALPRDLPAATGQLLVVQGEGEGFAARLWALERAPGGWRRRLGPLPAVVGRNGLARKGEKREGDGRTPSGLYPLEFVFGYAPTAPTAMPYRQATESAVWVDDPNSPDYNRWKAKGETSAASYESMKLPDQRYRHGVVIGYNRDPVVRGMGSAIFLHAWLERGRPTAGCVALDEGDLLSVIRWLDPAKGPMILLESAADLAGGAADDRGGGP